MPRPHKPRKRAPSQLKKTIPTVVAMAMEPQMELIQRQALASLADGWAGTAQFDELVDCRDFLAMGANVKKDEGVLLLCDAALEILLLIRHRYDTMGKITAESAELALLSDLVDVSQDFWGRTSGDFFIKARRAFWEARTQAG